MLKGYDSHDQLGVISAISLSQEQRRSVPYFRAWRQNVKADNIGCIWNNTKYCKLANFVPKDIGHLDERVHEVLE